MMPTGSSITMKTRSVFGADEYKTLSQLASNFGESTKLNRTEDLISSFISFLFSSGLLACEYDPSGIQKFKIPNAEVREVFFRRLEPYYHQIYAIDVVYFDKVTDEIAKLLETPDNSNLQHAFQQLVNQMPNFSSFHESSDPGIHPNEHSIHFPIDFVVLRLSIVDKMGFDFTLTGISQNRPDVAFMTKARDVAVILEMKFGNGDARDYQKILVRSIHVAENKNVTIKGRDMERGKLDLKTFLKQSHDELHPPPGKRMTRSQNTQTAVEKPLSGNETFNSYDSNKAFEVLDHDMPVYPSPDQRTASDYAETGSQTDDLVQSWETVEYKCCTLKRSLDDSLAENDCESSQLSSQKSTTTMDRGVQVLSDSFIMQLNMTAYKGQKGANDGFAKTRIYGSWETMDESATSTLCLEDTVVSNDCESLQLCAQNLVPNDVGQVLDVRKEELHHCLSPDQLKISVIGGRAVDALNTSADSSWCLVEGVNDTSTHSTENSLAGNDQESAQLCAQISEVVDEVVVLSKEDQLCLLPDRVEASARGGRAHNLLENSLDCRVESSQDVDGVINLARDDLENLQSSQADSIDAVVVDQIGSQVIEGCPIAHRQGSPNTGLQENGVAHLAGHLVHVAPDSISATDSLVIEAIDYFLQRLTFYEKIYGMGPLPLTTKDCCPTFCSRSRKSFAIEIPLIHFAESEQVCNAMLQGEAWWTDFLTWLESYVSFNDLVLQARQYWREVATKELENKEQQVVRPETSCAAVKYQDDFLAAVDPYPTVCSHCVAKKIQKREKQRSRLSFLPARLINRAIPQLSPLLPAAMDKQIKEKMEAEASDRRAWSMKEEERWRRMKSKAEPTHGYEHPEKAGQEGYSSASWRKEGADDDYQEKMRRDEEYYKDQTEKENLYWENRAREKEEREEEERCRERRLEEVEARQKEEREREDAAREREARQEEQRIREQSIRDDESVFYDHDPNNNSGKM
uniref:Uncharacterized protein n=1 Tax=Ditylenchus dipsaci TaxID=166011 RepID=A0A915DJZ6_9BILA